MSLVGWVSWRSWTSSPPRHHSMSAYFSIFYSGRHKGELLHEATWSFQIFQHILTYFKDLQGISRSSFAPWIASASSLCVDCVRPCAFDIFEVCEVCEGENCLGRSYGTLCRGCQASWSSLRIFACFLMFSFGLKALEIRDRKWSISDKYDFFEITNGYFYLLTCSVNSTNLVLAALSNQFEATASLLLGQVGQRRQGARAAPCLKCQILQIGAQRFKVKVDTSCYVASRILWIQ